MLFIKSQSRPHWRFLFRREVAIDSDGAPGREYYYIFQSPLKLCNSSLLPKFVLIFVQNLYKEFMMFGGLSFLAFIFNVNSVHNLVFFFFFSFHCTGIDVFIRSWLCRCIWTKINSSICCAKTGLYLSVIFIKITGW